MKTRVKICGVQTVADARYCAEQGADAIGLNFFTPSPRHVTITQAQQIVAALPPFVTTVGLFVNHEAEAVQQVLETVSLDCLQFHGDETNDFCQQFGKPWFKAIRMQAETNLQAQAAEFEGAQALLVDSFDPQLLGGTGKTFDWSLLQKNIAKPLILAGGLTPENVHAAITQVQPWAVDVAGGVESEKGVKSHEKIAAFIQQAQQ